MVVTTICKPESGHKIMTRLQPIQAHMMFCRAFCFDRWVNVLINLECHSLPCPYLLCKKDSNRHQFDVEELLFMTNDYQLCFDKKKVVWLVTGLFSGNILRVVG